MNTLTTNGITATVQITRDAEGDSWGFVLTIPDYDGPGNEAKFASCVGSASKEVAEDRARQSVNELSLIRRV